MKLVSLEQLEMLMFVTGSEHPVQTARDAYRRWSYIRSVALAARDGRILDRGLAQVVQDPQQYIGRSDAILAVLKQWLTEQKGRSAPEVS